jgi:hypothetical protein
MKRKGIYLAFIALLPLIAYSQEVEVKNYTYTVGAYLGIDKNINGYRMIENAYNNTFSASGITSWNFGFDYGYMINSKLRPRIQAKYFQMRYNANWDNANLEDLSQSTVYLFCGSANLRLDYLFFNSPKFQAFLSPALKWDFVIDREVKNIRPDGTHNWRSYNDIIDENPRSIMGGAVGALFKYNVTKNIGITVSPEYTYYFRNFVRVNDKSYQRMSISAGIEFNFY